MGNSSVKSQELPRGTPLKIVGEKYGRDKVEGVQDWVNWTAGRKDPFPLAGSFDSKVLQTVSTVLTEGKAGGPRQREKHWRALAAWLTEARIQTENKHSGLEEILNQRVTKEGARREQLKQALAQLEEKNDNIEGKITTRPGITKRIYPVLKEEGAVGGTDIQQFPMVQMARDEWVWRSWTPQDIRGVKASMEEYLKSNPRKAIKILHDQIKMHGATRTDIEPDRPQ